jgi:hypothetical protein
MSKLLPGHRILCTSPWPLKYLDEMYHRGPHQSAAKDFTQLLLHDMYNYVQKGYWVVPPYYVLCQLPQHCLAPAGVVLQRDRRPCPIMGYSFYGTNQECLPLAPTDTCVPCTCASTQSSANGCITVIFIIIFFARQMMMMMISVTCRVMISGPKSTMIH